MNPTDLSKLYPCGRISRRKLFYQAGGGFLGLALGAMWANGEEVAAPAAAASTAAAASPAGLLAGPHFSPRAKAVIFLFMCGGVSHIDTFDPKDNKWAGKFIDVIGFGDNRAEMRRPVIPCHRTFTRYGKSGIPVSDWFPHVGSVIDDIAVVRSMYCNEPNHFPAVIETCTGHRGRPGRLPDLRKLGHLCARNRQQKPPRVREHRAGVVACPAHRRVPRRPGRRHPIPAGQDADPQPRVSRGKLTRRT
jgi:hypothetical protein